MPYSSLSRFSSQRPLRTPGVNARAPSRETSSLIVKTNTSFGAGLGMEPNSAMAVATPIPLSAPKVVLRARIQPATSSAAMPCFSKSCRESAFFSQTISTCVWMMTGSADAAELVDAGLWTIKFP